MAPVRQKALRRQRMAVLFDERASISVSQRRVGLVTVRGEPDEAGRVGEERAPGDGVTGKGQ